MIFNSMVTERGKFPCDYTDEVIKNEQMFFNSNIAFAYENGGIITRNFIDSLPSDWKGSGVVLDSRVHMLMPEWYPCIPGWHHDDVPRSTKTGQPNYTKPEYYAEHLCGLVNAEICPTKFIDDWVNVSEPNIETTIYEQWSKEIQQDVDLDAYTCYDAVSGVLIEFDCNTFHTGVPAVKGGWRWFCRLSRNTGRTKNMTNEIRKQVQVYLENPIMGW